MTRPEEKKSAKSLEMDCDQAHRAREPGWRRGMVMVIVTSGMVIAALSRGRGRGVALEEPWTTQGAIVMKPGLTFNQMKELHDQLQQTQWASRFGSNVPKQVLRVCGERLHACTRMQAYFTWRSA